MQHQDTLTTGFSNNTIAFYKLSNTHLTRKGLRSNNAHSNCQNNKNSVLYAKIKIKIKIMENKKILEKMNVTPFGLANVHPQKRGSFFNNKC